MAESQFRHPLYWRSIAWFRRTAPSIQRGLLSSGDDGVAWTVRSVDDRLQALEVADNFIFYASEQLLGVIASAGF